MSGHHQPQPKPCPQDQQDMVQAAAMENFVRLQQSQEEYLAWLEHSVKKASVDGYVYKKIR